MAGKLQHKRATLSCIRKKRKDPLRPFLRDRSAGEICLTNTLSRKHGLPSKRNSLETLTISKPPSNKTGTVQHVYCSLLFSSSNVSRRGDIPLDMPQDGGRLRNFNYSKTVIGSVRQEDRPSTRGPNPFSILRKSRLLTDDSRDHIDQFLPLGFFL